MNYQTSKLKDNQTVYKYEFDSVNDLMNYIEKTPINKDIFKIVYSDKISSYNCGGIKSVKEAIDTYRHGVDINTISEFIKLNKVIDELIPVMTQKRNIKHNLYGFRPDITKSLRGNPKSMYYLKRNEQKKGLNFLLFPNSTMKASVAQINNLGVCVIQTVKLLEMMGYDISVYFLDLSYENENVSNKLNEYQEEYLCTQIKVKNDSEDFNPIISYFPLCHPAFPRRILLRLTEEVPVKLSTWAASTGKAIENIEEMQNLLPLFSAYNTFNQKIIINYDIFNKCISGEDIIKDFNNFLKYINFDSYLTKDQKEDYENQKKKLLKL